MWMNNSKRRIFFDMHFPDWEDRDIAKDFDPRDIAETFHRSCVDSAVIYAKCQYGNFYYDTALGHKHSGLGEQNLFGELTKEMHDRHMKVIAYYSVSWDEWVSNKHPEWLVRKADGSPDDEFRWQTLCINSPYREVVKSHIQEIMTLENPDGFWIDMTIIGTDKCYCPYCQEKFRQKYGFELPTDKEDVRYSMFMAFRYDYIESFYEELRALVKGINSHTIITNNYWGYPYSTATMGSRAIGATQSADFVTGEAYTDWTGLNAPSFFTKFLRGVGGGRPYEAVVGRFYNTWDYTVKPYEQMAFEIYSVIANGAIVTVDDEPYHDGSVDTGFYDDLAKIFQEVEKREAYIGGTSMKYAAILHSQKTKDYYNAYGNEAFIRSIAGSYKMLRDLHYPIDFIFDDQLDLNWSDYKVIVMPSTAVVDNELIERLTTYVQNGGTLLMSGVCGLYEVEDNGLIINNKLLKDAFDIGVEGIGEYSLSYMGMAQHPLVNHIERPILVKGPYVQYSRPENMSVYSQLVEPICETTKERFFHNNLPSPYKTIEAPANWYKKVGKGHIIGFAQPIFSHYAKQSQVSLRQLVQSSLAQVVGEPTVTFHCPNRMDVAIWETEDKMNIHMLNPNPGMSVCCGYMDPFEGAYPRTFEYMDEIIPVYDSKIMVNADLVEDVESVGEGANLTVEKVNGQCVIHIDKIDLWETISITKAK